MNDVVCVNVTEASFKSYMACYVAETMVYDQLHDIEDDQEVLWVRLKPNKLPRKYSCIIIACTYHPT